jgi:ATP-dependent DNA ligase
VGGTLEARPSDDFLDPEKLLAAAERMGLEGIVSKRRDSRYRSGRSDQWRKTKSWT